MLIDRRTLLKYGALAPLTGLVPLTGKITQGQPEKADETLRIATGLVELSPDHIVSTTIYNAQFPGPVPVSYTHLTLPTILLV